MAAAHGAVPQDLEAGLGEAVGEPGVLPHHPAARRGAELKPRLADAREHVAMDQREAQAHLTHGKDVTG